MMSLLRSFGKFDFTHYKDFAPTALAKLFCTSFLTPALNSFPHPVFDHLSHPMGEGQEREPHAKPVGRPPAKSWLRIRS